MVKGLSIILPVRWDSELLSHWLEMYERYSILPDNELIIIADQPTWETLRVLQKKCLKYHLVENSNLYTNWNLGAKLATRDFLMFMQEDYHFSPKYDYHILRRMEQNPKSWGGAFKLAPIDSDPVRSVSNIYNPPHFCREEGNILSFDFSAWENYCLLRSEDKIIPGHPLMYTFNKEIFDKIYGFGTGFSTVNGHIHHEATTFVRLSTQFNANPSRWEACDVYCLHYKFEAAKDLKQHKILYPPYIPDWGLKQQPWPEIMINGHCNNWEGIIHCRDCNNSCDPVYSFGGYPACEQNLERQKIVLQGYWLCDECKKKGSI